MLWGWEEDGDGFYSPCYIARSDERDQPLHTSRFDFRPSQHRFAWLVRHGFPKPARGNWHSDEIDIRIINERLFGGCPA